MRRIYITGLSGVGKSSVISELQSQGYCAIDLDYGYTTKNTSGEVIIDSNKLLNVIQSTEEHLIVSGCYSNQNELYKYFDSIVLLDCDLMEMLERIDTRVNNPFGKASHERESVVESYNEILPLLKRSSDIHIMTNKLSVVEVTDLIIGTLIDS